MLQLIDYVPIDSELVKYYRERIFNVPNSGWDKIEKDITVINDFSAPTTLRTYLLNHLPYCVIEIIKTKRF